jgi:hypothetical protein
MLRPPPGSREATPSSDKGASSDVAAHYAQEGVKGGNKRRKQRLQGTITMTSHDDTRNWDMGETSVRRTATTARIN